MKTLTNKNVKCRKNYRCDYCGTLIKKGDQSIYSTFIDCGDFHNSRLHIICNKAAIKYGDEFESYSMAYGQPKHIDELPERKQNEQYELQRIAFKLTRKQ